MNKLNNTYFLLRHGRNIHQTLKKGVCYGYPDDNPPCELDVIGIKQALLAAEKLKQKQIDLIYSSDTLRTKQTAEIVCGVLEKEVKSFNILLRDTNWGIYASGSKEEAYAFCKNKDRMETKPKNGESLGDVLKRMLSFIEEIDSKNVGKNILIVSHKEPILLLKSYFNNLDINELLKIGMETGEIIELN